MPSNPFATLSDLGYTMMNPDDLRSQNAVI
jgi:hypothetical protein